MKKIKLLKVTSTKQVCGNCYEDILCDKVDVLSDWEEISESDFNMISEHYNKVNYESEGYRVILIEDCTKNATSFIKNIKEEILREKKEKEQREKKRKETELKRKQAAEAKKIEKAKKLLEQKGVI